MQTSSGFFTDDFTHWPGALPVILMLSTFIGGCAGSTSGGMKVVRWLLLWQAGSARSRAARAPERGSAGQARPESRSIRASSMPCGASSACISCAFGVLMVLLIAIGEDQVTAFSAIAACMNNTGPGLGEVRIELRDADGSRQVDLPAGDAARAVSKSSRCWCWSRRPSGGAKGTAKPADRFAHDWIITLLRASKPLHMSLSSQNQAHDPRRQPPGRGRRS